MIWKWPNANNLSWYQHEAEIKQDTGIVWVDRVVSPKITIPGIYFRYEIMIWKDAKTTALKFTLELDGYSAICDDPSNDDPTSTSVIGTYDSLYDAQDVAESKSSTTFANNQLSQ